MSARTTATLVSAWQDVLAAEQRAAFGYALLGPQLAAGRQPAAQDDQTLHEQARDAAAGSVAALGAQPRPPLGDYPELYAGLGRPALLAASLEDACAAAWRYLYASTATRSLRAQAQAGLTGAAVRATRWRMAAGAGRAVTAFPGA